MEIILQQFNKGDEKAFKTLFDMFFKSSCAFVNKYVYEVDTVQDIVQETFIKIWEQRGKYPDIVYFKSYLYKSLRNNSLYHLRDNKKAEDISTALKDESEDLFKALITEEVHREIIQAIEKLPTERRKIIELSMRGLTHDEIAEDLNISVNTIKTQKRLAYDFLRKELKNLFPLLLFIINL